ncbi:helix-turn-helix domain-containing protein [Flavobacteriaceae bacterium]|nr:helix-turn-helix domain-containing protein [Flavobacteriaceae bacterium]
MVKKPKFDLIMKKFSIQNIEKISALNSELEVEKATNLYLKLRVLAKENKSYKILRKHLSKLIKDYEDKNWSISENITNKQVKESDLAEQIVQEENDFYSKRKEIIRERLKESGLNQTDLAKILGHRKSYISELINGVRPFSKEDLIIINRLFKIELENLIPTFIKEDKVLHIRKTLKSILKSRIRLTKKDLNLESYIAEQPL